jgi:long-chain fatty acid transport protein
MSARYRAVILQAALAVVTVLKLSVVNGAGFYLSEVGTPGSLGTAGVANPTNTKSADSAWTNPAAMTYLQQNEILAGAQLVLPKIEFDSSFVSPGTGGGDGGNAGNSVVIPSFFYVNKLSERLRFGFSVAGTMGGGVDYGDNFVGRYSTIKAELGAVGISPSLGYKVNDRLSVGAGVAIIYTRYDQDIAINQSLVNAADATLKIEKATDWGYQPFLGLTYQLSDRAMLGVVYRAEMDVELEGDVKVKNWQLPGSPSADSIDVDWDNPQWLEVGLQYQLDDRNTMFLNAGWQEWSAFSNNALEFSGGALNPAVALERNFDDTWHAGIAFVHVEGGHGTSIGFSYDSSPVNDKDRTLDLPFDEFYKVSMSYFWKGSKQLDFALGGTLYMIGDSKINQTSPGPNGTQVIGEFDTNNILFLGGTVRYRF